MAVIHWQVRGELMIWLCIVPTKLWQSDGRLELVCDTSPTGFFFFLNFFSRVLWYCISHYFNRSWGLVGYNLQSREYNC